jgi:hypothetical protein
MKARARVLEDVTGVEGVVGAGDAGLKNIDEWMKAIEVFTRRQGDCLDEPPASALPRRLCAHEPPAPQVVPTTIERTTPPSAPLSPPLSSLAASPKSTSVPSTYRLDWAALLKRVFGVDVLKCSRCQGQMRLIACIEEPDVAKKILVHLGLPSEPLPTARAQAPPVTLDLFPEA